MDLFKKITCWFLLLFCGVLNAQKIDSLKRELKKQTADTEIVFILVNIGDYYSNKNQTDSAINYLNVAVSKAQKATNKKYLGFAYYYLGLAYSNAGQDSKGRYYMNKAVSIYLSLNKISKLGDVYNSIGVTYYYEGKYDSAIICYNTAAGYGIKNKDSLLVGKCYNNIGTMYDIKGERVKSVENYIKAITIYENKKREDLCIGPYQNMSLVYLNNKQYPQALKCLETAKKIAIEYKENRTLCRIYNSIGSALDGQGKSIEANRVFKKALLIAKTEKDEAMAAICLNNLGENSLFLNKNEEAEKILLECVELKKKLNNKVSLGISEIGLGQAYVRNKKYAQAITSFKSGLIKVNDAGYLEYQKMGLEGLASSYGHLASYREAYLNLDSFVKINNKLQEESNNKVISELETKYQSEKKEGEIKLLTKNQQLQNEEIKRKQNEIKFAIAGGALVFILLIIVIFSWRNKQKANKLLEEKNAEIHFQKDLIEEKQKEVMDSIRYAKRIQQSLLPTEKYIARNLKQKD